MDSAVGTQKHYLNVLRMELDGISMVMNLVAPTQSLLLRTRNPKAASNMKSTQSSLFLVVSLEFFCDNKPLVFQLINQEHSIETSIVCNDIFCVLNLKCVLFWQPVIEQAVH